MANWFSSLQASLQQANFETHSWRVGEGSLLISPHGARVLACELPGVEGNLFWHNPGLEDAAAVPELMEKAGGDIGGDRFWIAPEVAYMWPDLAKARMAPFETYKLSPEMDPAQWQVASHGANAIELTTQMSLTDHRVRKQISLNVSRSVHVVDAPADLPANLSCVSFGICNQVQVLSGDRGAVAGGWDLLQLPSTPDGGELVCQTVGPVAQPRSYYDDFAGHVKTDDKSVRFHVDGNCVIKMGLAPHETTGRMAYIRRAGDVTTMIYRTFLPMPGETYVDVPRSSDDRFGGDALQAFCGNASFGGFGEMEYHDPAVVAGRGPQSRSGSCVTHVMAGPDAVVREYAQKLLDVAL